ncbi:MAG: hypothetical protein NXY57DRAFT_970423 [Lentinula lateritia]|nr:MAG: hypothetical protein NXY57DRAFT_970423 [Lentinula lateritia]
MSTLLHLALVPELGSSVKVTVDLSDSAAVKAGSETLLQDALQPDCLDQTIPILLHYPRLFRTICASDDRRNIRSHWIIVNELFVNDLSSPDLLVVDVNGTLIRNVYIPPKSSRTNWRDWSDMDPWDAFVENTQVLMQLDTPSITGGDINARIGELLPHSGHPD